MTARTLHIGAGFEMPLDLVTQTTALLGKRGVGKTATAVVMVEEMLDHNAQVVVIDPVGVWWGLRSSADGKGKGHPILIIGGEHGDIPLEPTAGKLVANFVVTKRASVVIDVGELSKTAQQSFVAEFLEQLYRMNRSPLHLVLDEADAFAPQRLNPGITRCFGAVDTVVRRGRARGIGVTLVTQRSAAINKDVLTQVEVLIVFRTLAPQDRMAIEAWVEVHADKKTSAEMLGSLQELGVGEAWVWSPSWLQRLSRVQVRRRRTFDSSATPKMGQVTAAPKAIAAVDVEALRGELASLVKKAEDEDPKRLRARIAQLEREMKKQPAAAPPATARVERVEVPVLDRRIVREIQLLADRLHKLEATLEEAVTRTRAIADQLNSTVAVEPTSPVTTSGRTRETSVTRPSTPAPAPSGPHGPGSAARVVVYKSASVGISEANGRDPSIGNGGLSRLLVALAQRRGDLTHSQLGLRAGVSSRGGSFRTWLSRGRQAGWIEGRGSVRITDAGLRALGSYSPLPEGPELLEYWLAELGAGGAARLLRALADAYPQPLTRTSLGEAAGVSENGGSFRTWLSRLRGLQLIEGRGELRASDELFGGAS